MNWLAWLLIVLGVVLLIVLVWLLIRRRSAPLAPGTSGTAGSVSDAAPARPLVSDVDARHAARTEPKPRPEPRPEPELLVEEDPTGEIPVLTPEPAPMSEVDSEPAAGDYPGSVKPLAGGASPSSEYTIKGNADSMLFHAPESPYYSRTKAEVWFKTGADAEAAGFTAWNKRRTQAAEAKSAKS